MTRTTVMIGLAVVILAAGGIALLLISRANQPRLDDVPARYDTRELWLPDNRFLFPDVEAELFATEMLLFVDGEQPLPAALVERVREDADEALEEALNAEVRARMREIILNE